jgi:rhodanese-related sulfurtransferase
MLSAILAPLQNLFAKSNALEPDEVRQLVKADPKTVLIDVRMPQEYRTEHLNPCININWRDKAEFEHKTKYLEKDKAYILYCQSGSRSDKARKKLEKIGFENVFTLKGGINQWMGNKKLK